MEYKEVFEAGREVGLAYGREFILHYEEPIRTVVELTPIVWNLWQVARNNPTILNTLRVLLEIDMGAVYVSGFLEGAYNVLVPLLRTDLPGEFDVDEFLKEF